MKLSNEVFLQARVLIAGRLGLDFTDRRQTDLEQGLVHALFGLMFLIFFRLFPAVSIWEVAEGRVIEEAHSQIVIPAPEPTETRRLRRWGIRK